jgi:hypothetical protein
VDDELKALNLEKPRQRGPDPALADSEVITIELVGEHLGLDRDARLVWHFRQYHAREFPGLTGVHRTAFAPQAGDLTQPSQAATLEGSRILGGKHAQVNIRVRQVMGVD